MKDSPALLNNSVLQYLTGGNEIDDVGAKELARVLASSSSPWRVSLFQRAHTDYGANSIAGALRELGPWQNSGPTHLDLADAFKCRC